eukprot:TRINITY_DN3972_c1_g1_i1.p1 TRINITY_DN3972_c1_g1~~TRINITY_DN3972_c1_g1_i1.p1  ORF type:complete len:1128 (-),score=401.05 TRINITY_DN3972_c1_g1_i1:39-3422(-)
MQLLKKDVNARIRAAQIFCIIVAFLFSSVVFPTYWVLASIGISLIFVAVWSFSVGRAFLLAISLLMMTVIYICAPYLLYFATTIRGSDVDRPISIIHLGSEKDVSLPQVHGSFLLRSDSETPKFDSADFRNRLAEALMISPSFITIIIRRQTVEYTEFLLNIHQARAAENAATMIRNLPPALRKYAITEIREESARIDPPFSTMPDDDMFGGEAIIHVKHGPTITLSGGGHICTGENSELIFTMTPNNPPWNISYYFIPSSLQYTSSRAADRIDLVNVIDNPLRIEVNRSGHYQLFNPEKEKRIFEIFRMNTDASRCPAERLIGDVDVFESPFPTGKLTCSQWDFCEGESTKLTLTLTGIPPWHVTLTDGRQNLEYSNITSSPHEISVDFSGDFRIVKIISGKCVNDRFPASAITIRSHGVPRGSITGGRCQNDDIILKFTGVPPFRVPYQYAGRKQEEFATRNSHTLKASAVKYIFDEIIDKSECRGNFDGIPIELNPKPLPTATLSPEGGHVFPGKALNLKVELSGISPWTLTYTDGAAPHTIQVENSPHEISAKTPGDYRLLEVVDQSGCSGNVYGTSKIVQYELPTAKLKFPTDSQGGSQVPTGLCEGGESQVHLHLTGTAPWKVEYYVPSGKVFQVEEITRTPFTLVAKEAGVFGVSKVWDSFGNLVQLQDETFNLKMISKATATILNPQNSYKVCQGDFVDISVELTGVSPWTLTWTDGHQVFSEISEKSPHVIRVKKSGTYKLVSVKSVSHSACTSELVRKGQVSQDEIQVEIFPAPTCHVNTVTGCEMDDITVTCQGMSPFEVTYTVTSSQRFPASQTFTRISDFPEFKIRANSSGIYQVIEVVDGNKCRGVISHHQNSVGISPLPTATLTGPGDQRICNGERNFAEISVNFQGTAPFAFSYTDGVNVFSEKEIHSNKFVLKAGEGNYTLTSVSDAKCSHGNLHGGTQISTFYVPTVSIEGGGSVCPYEGAKVPVTFHLTGTAPWQLKFSDGRNVLTTEALESPLTIFATSNATYQVISVKDVNCQGQIVSDVARVSFYPKPKAFVTGGTVCKGSTMEFMIEFEKFGMGPPWNVSYSNGVWEKWEMVPKTPHVVKVDEEGSFHITQIGDPKCHYRRSHP